VDVRLFARVLWRFRFLTVFGILAAVALALLSYARVDFDGGVPTIQGPAKVWQSDSTLFVTERGAPWGRSILDAEGEADAQTPAFSDPSRFIGLAALYARLTDSDAVRRILLRDGPIRGTYSAVPVKSSDGSTLLPMIAVLGYGNTPAVAEHVADRVAVALQVYLREHQQQNSIPAAKRVELPFLNHARKATVADEPSPAKPAFIFFLIAGLTVGIAFVLENLRPRRDEGLRMDEATAAPAPIARSA
jgi:hypothetical protein